MLDFIFEKLFPTFGKCIFCNGIDDNAIEKGICKCCERKLVFCEDDDAVFLYEGEITKVIQDLKYNRKKYLAKIFAKYCLDKIDVSGYDYITFVPMHKVRKRKRGYNQVEAIYKSIDKDKTKKLLVKVKDIPSQTTLSREERCKNVIGAYKLANDINISGKNILLIDDVKTTGSTIYECKKQLEMASAKRVDIFTVCKKG